MKKHVLIALILAGILLVIYPGNPDAAKILL